MILYELQELQYSRLFRRMPGETVVWVVRLV